MTLRTCRSSQLKRFRQFLLDSFKFKSFQIQTVSNGQIRFHPAFCLYNAAWSDCELFKKIESILKLTTNDYKLTTESFKSFTLP